MTTIAETQNSLQRRTRVRVAVVAMAMALGVVTYLQRACLGPLKGPMMDELGVSQQELSYVDAAFALSYGLFGIASARWADRVGTRKMLTIVVIVWSLSTFATGFAQGLVTLLLARLVFGVGESGAWPATTRTLSRWIPYSERGTAQGVVWVGAHLAAGLTPALVHELTHGISWHGVVLLQLSWRNVFAIFSLTGIVWAVAWYWWFRDEPSEHAQVNPSELSYIMAGRTSAAAPAESPSGWAFWRRLLSSRTVWALCLMYLPNSFIFYFCITWFQTYLHEARGMDGRELAFFAGLPFLLSVAGDALGGAATDWAVRRWGPRWGRAGVGFVSYLAAATCILLAAATNSAWIAGSLFAIGTAANMFIMGSSWGTCQDIGGQHAGTVSATMNTAGQIGGALICPLLVIFIKRHFTWDVNLVVIGVSFVLGAICWGYIDPREKVFE